MLITKRPFIKMPYFLKLDEQKLNYQDILTYIAVKSFDNPESECFPSYETIAETSGMSRDFTIKSIKRLRQAGYIEIWRRDGFSAPNKSFPNHYYFKKLEKGDHFFMTPYDVLEIDDLKNVEKAMLILLNQFTPTPSQIYGTIQELADQLGLTKQIVYKNYLSLVKKGYIEHSKLKKHKISKLLKIDWDFSQYLKIALHPIPMLKVG